MGIFELVSFRNIAIKTASFAIVVQSEIKLRGYENPPYSKNKLFFQP